MCIPGCCTGTAGSASAVTDEPEAVKYDPSEGGYPVDDMLSRVVLRLCATAIDLSSESALFKTRG